MSDFDKNMSTNHLTTSARLGKKPGDLQKININAEKNTPQLNNTTNNQQIKTTPSQSLVSTNTNVTINQPVLNNPVVNQSTLNTSNQPQIVSNTEVKNTLKQQVQPTPMQREFQGPKDLPAYAGIANMSLKSWIAQNNQNMSDVNKTQLAGLFEAIKGFEQTSYQEESKNGIIKKINDAKQNRRKSLILLSNMFASIEQSGSQETELIASIANFKKLGKKRKNQESTVGEKLFVLKSPPPTPEEVEKQKISEGIKVKHLHELFALPREFPECLRLFASDYIEINPQYFKSFLVQRLKIVEENLFKGDNPFNTAIKSFIPLLSQGESQLLIPLLLLYYPLPLPLLNQKIDFIEDWKSNKKEKTKSAIATCEIYYISKARGRFLIRFELACDCGLSVDIQTAKENNGIARDIELAVEEGMLLLEHSPKLSELNVLLTDEIYKATDVDEELSIVSSGPLRLEIVIAAYSALTVLNKLGSNNSDPAGLIEMLD